MRAPRKGAPARRKPPEEGPSGSVPQKRPENRQQVEVVIEPSGSRTAKPKATAEVEVPARQPEAGRSRRATVEEVEDSEDERDYVRPRKVNDELPFRNVVPMEEAPSAPVLPRKPTEPSASAAREPGPKRKRAAKNTEKENSANIRLVEEIRNLQVPTKLGDLIDSNSKLLRALAAEAPKSRWVNFVKTTEGDIRASKFSTLSVTQVYEDGEQGAASDGESVLGPVDLNERLEPTDLTIVDEKGYAMKMLMFDTFPEVVTTADHALAEGSIIIGDPVLQYFESLAPDQKPMDIKLAVAPLSGKLRCLFPHVRGIKVESIADSGSQIVSMSLETALKLGLDWDTRMTILMQVANEQVQKTLGLAKNVQFKFGGVTLYLQVHILKAAPYDVLLGRPFEMLAETVVANKKNGDVFVTLTDPFTGVQSTLPTFPRGHGAGQDAPNSNASTDGSASREVPQDF